METIEKAYEKYKLQWLIDHGFTIENLICELEEARKEFHPETPLTEVFSAWEDNSGFGSQIWACREEWEACENKAPEVQTVLLPVATFSSIARMSDLTLCLAARAEENPEYGPEIIVALTDETGYALQDLVHVHEKKNAEGKEPVMEVILFENELDEGYTSKKWIPVYPHIKEDMNPDSYLSEDLRTGVRKYPESWPDVKAGKLSPEEALVRSISDMRKVDMRHMEDLTGLSMDDLMIALRGKIYMLPDYPHDDDGYPKFTTAGEYLSGSREILERRLADAINYAEMSEAFDENIIALQKTLCGMSFSMDPTSIKGIESMGGRLDKYGIPHFDAEVFKTMQHTGDSVTYPGKKTVMIPGENGPALIIEGINFLIDNRKE